MMNAEMGAVSPQLLRVLEEADAAQRRDAAMLDVVKRLGDGHRNRHERRAARARAKA